MQSPDAPILGAAEEARLNELEWRHGRDDQPILSEREALELKSLRARRAAPSISQQETGERTPLHEFVALAKEAGLAIDVSLYATGDEYRGGVRLTAPIYDDPMDAFANGVAELKRRASASSQQEGGD